MTARTTLTLSTASDECKAAAETAEQLRSAAGSDRIAGGILYSTVGFDGARLQASLREQLPGIPFLGASSCLAVGTPGGRFNQGAAVGGLWLLGDGFRFGVAGAEKQGRDPETLGVALASAAVSAGGFAPEKARFAVINPMQGEEELVLGSVHQTLGNQTTIIGGTPADNDLSGKAFTFTHELFSTDAVTLAVCDWPWKIAVNYQGGYLPTPHRGQVTRARGRVLLEIDGRPAAEVYNDWTGGLLGQTLRQGGNVLGLTTMAPLGVTRGLFGGIEAYVLAHPERVLPEEKALVLFTRIREGEQVALMFSSQEALVQRGANVARTALNRAGLRAEQIVGALLVYCGGCTLAIQQHMPRMLEELESVTGAVPYLGYFSFGEQGCVLPRQVDHGNLMASMLLLSVS